MSVLCLLEDHRDARHGPVLRALTTKPEDVVDRPFRTARTG
jgi:hypothetical protein